MREPEVLTLLRPVEERFVRALPGQAGQQAAALFVVDGGPLRDARGRLDVDGIRRHGMWWLRAHPSHATRLASSPFGLVPPAWVSSDRPVDLAVVFWPQPCAEADFDTVVADLHRRPIDVATSPLTLTVLDDPAGPVGLVVVAHHAFTDGVAGVPVLQRLASSTSGPLRVPPDAPPRTGRTGPITLPVLVAARWWRRQPSVGAALRSWRSTPLTGRLRRMLGRQRWAARFALARLSRTPGTPRPAAAFRRIELPLDVVRPRAKAAGGNLTDILAVATATALATATGPAPAAGPSARGVHRVLVPMADTPASGAVVANRLRVVPVAVDVEAPLEVSVPEVRRQLQEGDASATAHCAAHATTLVGPRTDLFVGPALVRQMAMMPSLAPGEDFGVLALMRRRTVTLALAARDPDQLPAFAASLVEVLSGAPALSDAGTLR
jgi:hypothetical protein